MADFEGIPGPVDELEGQEVPAPVKRSLIGLLLDNKVKSALVALALAVAAYFGLGV